MYLYTYIYLYVCLATFCWWVRCPTVRHTLVQRLDCGLVDHAITCSVGTTVGLDWVERMICEQKTLWLVQCSAYGLDTTIIEPGTLWYTTHLHKAVNLRNLYPGELCAVFSYSWFLAIFGPKVTTVVCFPRSGSDLSESKMSLKIQDRPGISKEAAFHKNPKIYHDTRCPCIGIFTYMYMYTFIYIFQKKNHHPCYWSGMKRGLHRHNAGSGHSINKLRPTASLGPG